MTKEEAIKILKSIRVYECYPKSASEETKEAIDMAIDALQDEAPKPTGEWIDKGNWMGVECSRCNCHSRYVTPFCPQCGARMKGADNE